MENSKKRPVRYTRYYDFALLFLTIGIALFGIVMIYSAGYYTAAKNDDPYRYVKQQGICLVIGVIGMIGISKFDYQILYKRLFGKKITLSHVAYITAFVLQIAVAVIGVEINGAKRWLRLGPIQFQPSELSKIAVILLIAYAIYQKREALDHFAGFLRLMLYAGLLIIPIAIENLSAAIIVAGIFGGMCFIASKKVNYFLIIIGVGVVVGTLVLLAGDSYRSARLQIWLDVENHEKGFQILQGLYAVASGGLFGKGLGESMQKLGYIPESYNDMIFAIICEELGMVGAIIVVLAFVILLWRILFIACHAPDLYGSMLCLGVLLQLGIQVVLNIAVVTNSMPSTGISLPLISYGGTSAMIIMMEIGLVLGVSRQIKQK